MALIRFIALYLLLSFSGIAMAADEIQVIGLFKNAAMVDYAGKQKLYRAGQNLSPSIKLVKADPHSATFLVDGKELVLSLQQTTHFKAGQGVEVQSDIELNKVASIRRNNAGMFKTPGFINGIAVEFLVDTGASQVALNEQVAQQAGLLYELYGKKVPVNTAAGVAFAWAITLKKVRVGGIELHNVDALVIKGTGPNEVLLGMSFLSRVKLENDGQLMQLTQKY